MKYEAYAKTFNASEEVLFWVTHNLANHLKANTEDQDEIEHIIDYLVSPECLKRLKGMAYAEAKANAEKWTKTQQKKGEHIKEVASDTETVLDFKDGFRVVKLVGKNAYDREGYLMRHCVASYYGKSVEIYSLRDKDNMPHCTMEKDQQIKGKGNGDIHPKYINYVVKFLEHVGMKVGDNEMRHLGYLNVEKIKKDLHKDTKFFNEKYLPENEKLIGKDGEEFASLELLDLKPLVKEDTDSQLKINFDLPPFIKLSIEWLFKNNKVGFLKKTTSDERGAKLAASGDSAQLAASGHYAKLASSGDYAQLAASGYKNKLEISGNDSVGANIGYGGSIKGKKGSWITLAEYDDNSKPVCVKSVQIDGKEIKEDVWYKLVGKKFVEVK